MAKSKKSKKGKKSIPSKTKQSQSNFISNIKPWQTILACVLIIMLATAVFLFDLSFKGMVPAGSDVLASKGKTNLMKTYEEKTGEESLWNPAIFSGMPQYHRYGPRSWSLDILASWFFDDNGGQVIVYYIIGAVGMFVLLYSFGFSPFIALFGALAFLLMPHYNNLWQAGHFSKFRAIMYIPWVIAAFQYFLTQRTILGSLLYILAFSLQIRTQHYQIIFYTALVLFAIGIYPLIKLIIEKKFAELGKLIGLFIVSSALVVLTVYQPFFCMKEYTPYSTRGGNPVHIQKQDDSAAKAKGVSFEYATRWSLSPKETICFLIPRYFGGSSQEIYRGDAVPQLKGRAIPGYWGDMPFTGSTDYIGVVLFVLLIFGIYGFRHDWRVVSLGIFTIFALLLAFGRHFPAFYKIFFYYMPYFSKFRIPTMIMMAVFVAFVIFAAFGLKYLLDPRSREDKNTSKVLYWIAGFLFIISMSPFVLKGSLPLATSREMGQFSPQILQFLKDARFDLMKTDAIRTLIFSVVALSLIFAYLRKWVAGSLLTVGLILIMLFDVMIINARFKTSLQKQSRLEAAVFPKSKIDDYLLEQAEQSPEPFRVLGLAGHFSNNNLAYYHQCIGGYDAAKMQTIQDIIENNLYAGRDPRLPLNWDVVNFLNGKYIVSDGMLNHDNLTLLQQSGPKGPFLYENKTVLPRSFLVGQYKKFDKPVDIVSYLNNRKFNPRQIACLEKPLPGDIEAPDSLSYSRVTSFTPNKIELEAATSSPCLLVLSETFYPKGWRALVDGQETEIYKTNHILRSIMLPEGTHKIVFSFRPESYVRGKFIATIANLLVLLSIISLLTINYLNYRKKA